MATDHGFRRAIELRRSLIRERHEALRRRKELQSEAAAIRVESQEIVYRAKRLYAESLLRREDQQSVARKIDPVIEVDPAVDDDGRARDVGAESL